METCNSNRLPRVWIMAVVAFLFGCATTVPPSGAPQMAGPKWPGPGSKEVVRAKKTGSYGSGTEQVTYTWLGTKPWQGRDLVAVTDGTKTFYFAERGWVATAVGTNLVESADPEVQMYDWPLAVGRRWQTTFTYRDAERGRTFRNVKQDVVVEAYEDVQTPAGTFKTYKIVRGNDAYQQTVWLNPESGMWVKWRDERFAGDYLGVGTLESELLSLDVKQ